MDEMFRCNSREWYVMLSALAPPQVYSSAMVHPVADRLSMRRQYVLDSASADAIAAAFYDLSRPSPRESHIYYMDMDFAEKGFVISRHHQMQSE